MVSTAQNSKEWKTTTKREKNTAMKIGHSYRTTHGFIVFENITRESKSSYGLLHKIPSFMVVEGISARERQRKYPGSHGGAWKIIAPGIMGWIMINAEQDKKLMETGRVIWKYNNDFLEEIVFVAEEEEGEEQQL